MEKQSRETILYLEISAIVEVQTLKFKLLTSNFTEIGHQTVPVIGQTLEQRVMWFHAVPAKLNDTSYHMAKSFCQREGFDNTENPKFFWQDSLRRLETSFNGAKYWPFDLMEGSFFQI